MTGKAEMMFDIIPTGSGGRWAYGNIILIYLIAYNETSGPTAVFSTLLAAFYGFVSAICKSGAQSLQIPYIRATNKFDYTCMFLAMWMDSLAILTACSSVARTLSMCLDAMTGGLARILILGRNSIENEPWPDVLGVGVIFLVTGMFMLGLENTRIFGIVMTVGMLGISGIISAISWFQGNTREWHKDYLSRDGLNSFLTAAALGAFTYPPEMPNKQGWKRLFGVVLIICVCISTILAAVCLSTLIHTTTKSEYIAVPLFLVIEENNYHKLVPAAACLLMLATSGSLLELFTEMFNMIVRLATNEWKILSKQISYESSDSGNPVLAIFIGGSLCAMLAFACPLQNLIHTLAASHLCAGIFRAFYLLYSPYRPKYIQHNNETTSTYSRLSSSSQSANAQNSISRRRNMWNFSLPMNKTINSRAKKKANTREVEKEWLLLGEPSSPCPVVRDKDAESTMLSDGEPPISDFEFAEHGDNSDSDTSTDIDAIVDEYREKIKVTTAGPTEKTIRMPSLASWRVTIFAILLIAFGIGLMIFGIYFNLLPAYITGFIGIFLVSIMMSFIPKYTAASNVSPILSTISLTIGSILLSSCLTMSWVAILFWIFAGIILLMRCDNWCCTCFDRPLIEEQLIQQQQQQQQSSQHQHQSTRRVRLPRPPKNILISGRVPGQKSNINR